MPAVPSELSTPPGRRLSRSSSSFFEFLRSKSDVSAEGDEGRKNSWNIPWFRHVGRAAGKTSDKLAQLTHQHYLPPASEASLMRARREAARMSMGQ